MTFKASKHLKHAVVSDSQSLPKATQLSNTNQIASGSLINQGSID